MCLGSGSGASAQRQQQEVNQQAIEKATKRINQTFSGFNDDFYKKRTKASLAESIPQLNTQLQQTQKQLGYNLGSRGLQNSSAATQLGESLSKEATRQTQGVVDQAENQTNQLKQQVANQQSTLVSEANAANDPGSVAGEALSAASSFQAPSWVPPLGQAFGDWANVYLAGQNNKTYSNPQTLFPLSTSSGGYGSSLMQPTTNVR
jgi:hypothetical protein